METTDVPQRAGISQNKQIWLAHQAAIKTFGFMKHIVRVQKKKANKLTGRACASDKKSIDGMGGSCCSMHFSVATPGINTVGTPGINTHYCKAQKEEDTQTDNQSLQTNYSSANKTIYSI